MTRRPYPTPLPDYLVDAGERVETLGQAVRALLVTPGDRTAWITVRLAARGLAASSASMGFSMASEVASILERQATAAVMGRQADRDRVIAVGRGQAALARLLDSLAHQVRREGVVLPR